MELGSLEFQIFVGLVVVLGTAFVALVCDYLKGHNEQLRERNIELRVRQEERERLGLYNPAAWLQGMTALAQQPSLATAGTSAAEPVPVQQFTAETTVEQSPSAGSRRQYKEDRSNSRATSWASKEELEQLADRAARIRARHEGSEQQEEPKPPVVEEPRIQAEEPAPASAQEAAGPAQAEPAASPVAANPESLRPKILRIDHASDRYESRENLNLSEELQRISSLIQPEEAVIGSSEDMPEPAPAAEVEVEAEAGQVAEAAAGIEKPAETAIEEEPAAAAPAVPVLEIPSGMQDANKLAELLAVSAPFHGVVAVIGINDYEALQERIKAEGSPDALISLDRMIRTLLGQQDFACRRQDDEYVLLYPGENGSSAQRRLFQVSEKLWDFQLRSLGNFSVMFSWGGLEAQGETLAEAVESARERMYQTKRNRKPSGSPLMLDRRVVNG